MEYPQATNQTTANADDEQTVIYRQPKPEALSATASGFLQEVNELVIDSGAMYQIGAETMQNIKGKITSLNEQRMAITRPIDAAKAAVMDLFRAPVATLTQAEAAIKGKLIKYDNEQAAIARAAQVKADNDARIAREKLDKEAREAVQQAEFLRAAAATAATPDQARELEDQAGAASEVAMIATATAQITVAAPVVATVTKVSGVSTARPWKARLVSKVELIKWVAQDPEQRQHFLDANESALTAQAKATKENTRIGGVEAFQDVVMSARGARAA